MNQFLQKLFLAVCSLAVFSTSNAQVDILTPDTTICDGQSATLRATNAGAVPVNSSLVVDDQWGGVSPLGFSFTFYGTAYTQCWISPNGYLSFNSQTSGSTSPYNPNGVAIPGTTQSTLTNSIMGIWNDIDPGVAGSGSITFATTGTAPFRKFVVSYCDIPMWTTSCNAFKESFQIVLFETTNIIEVHIRDKPICLANWSGNAVQGVYNAAGTIAHLTPGRGYPLVPWTASLDGRRFTPTNATTYTIDSIPFNPLSTAGGGTITWYNNANVQIGTGPTVVVTPAVTQRYYARQIYCADTTRDSVLVTLGGNPNVDSIQVRNPSYCGANDGELILFGLQPNTNFRINYTRNGVAQPQINLGSSGAGTLTMSNLDAATYNSIAVSTPLCNAANSRGPYTLVNPRIPVDFTILKKYTCLGVDSAILTNTTSIPNTTTYRWDFGDGNFSTQTNPAHGYANQGAYTIKLTADNGFCRDSISKPIDTRHPLDAFFLADYTDGCQGQVLNFRDSSIVTIQDNIAPTYTWDYGDGNTDIGPVVSHAYANVGTYIVRLVVKDFVPCTDTFYRTITVNPPPTLSFVSDMNNICEGQSSTFTADFHGSAASAYEWEFSDGTLIRDINPIRHAFDSAGLYTIKLTSHYEFCPDTNYSLQVNVNAFPGINIGPDTSLCPNASVVTLRNFADFGNYPGATYLWSNGATTPSIAVRDIGTYSATVNYNGCTATDSMTIFKDCYLDVPNSFTPNGDGMNDYFLPRQLLSRGVQTYKMSIYNRWGQVIFETTAFSGRGWDGKFNNEVQPQGVYIYVIDVSYTDGRKENYTSNVTLLR